MNGDENEKRAEGIYQSALERVSETPEPEGQKFPVGTLVKIADELDNTMDHFPKGKFAIVEYTYAHAYGGSNVRSYSLKIYRPEFDRKYKWSSVSWYLEHQLSEVL